MVIAALAAAVAFTLPGCGADEPIDTQTTSEALTAKKKKPRLCGGSYGDSCPSGYYCKKRDGMCEDKDIGKCTAIPDACTLQYDPVCGCDGVTYGNACVMAMAGVTLLHEGECGEPPGCTHNGDCPKWQFCKMPTGSCGEGEKGECANKPHVCTLEYDPVCGCDGVTYSNTCHAWAEGVSVQHEGECDSGGDDCLSDADCPPGHICEIETYCPDCVYYDPPCLAPCWAKGTCVEACPQILCMEGTWPYDSDGDGCDDTCKPQCLSDADCKPGQVCEEVFWCPCPYGDECDAPCFATGVCVDGPGCDFDILCVPGLEPVDTDGDGCNDTCKAPCEDACDCYEADISFDTPCMALCPTCDNYWACEAGYCETVCGAVPPELPEMCKVAECDEDADCPPGEYCALEWECPCPDGADCLAPCFLTGGTCQPFCDFVIDCMPGYVPVDSDGDGCNDSCEAPCEHACDCYDAGLEFWDSCDLECATCDNYWTCSDAGYCKAECGPVPWEAALCKESECLSDDECKEGYCEITTVCPCPEPQPGEPACLAPCYLIGECKPFPDPGCCKTDADCGGGQVCVNEVCKEKPPMGQCWSDSDCFGDSVCSGASVCPCGAACFVADTMGQCVSIYEPCDDQLQCKDGFSCECLSDPSCPVCDVCWFGCVPKEPVGCYGDQDCPDGTKCNAADICLPPPGCDVPGAICPAVCYGYCE